MENTTELDDDACALQAQRGQRAAFTELVRRFQDRIYRFLLRLLRSEDDARDLTQDTFLKAFQALPDWTLKASFGAWLFRIARNLAFDRLRRQKALEFVPLDPTHDAADSAPGPAETLHQTQRLRQLDAAVAQLPLEQREVLLLREVEGMAYDDIATVLGIAPGTVKSRLARARQTLIGQCQL